MLIIVGAAVPSRKESDDESGDESAGDGDVAEPAELVGAGST